MKNILKDIHLNLEAENSKSNLAKATALQRSVSMDKFVTSDKIQITMTKDKFIESIVTWVAVESLPIRFFSTKSYDISMGEIARKLGVSLSRDSVKGYVLKAAQKLADKITEILVNI